MSALSARDYERGWNDGSHRSSSTPSEATVSSPTIPRRSLFLVNCKNAKWIFYARTWSAPSRSKDFLRYVHLSVKGELRYWSNEIYFFILILIRPSFSQSVSNLNKSIQIRMRRVIYVSTVREFYYVVVTVFKIVTVSINVHHNYIFHLRIK